ncbi:MAG: hypothetical protein VB013_05360 [Anaerolineaceae bacterium]|nr:hypothetical protein [Anaerolineaceae bacterium]
MKKPIKFLLVITTLVFCLAFVGLDLAQAETSWKDPWIHPYIYARYIKAKVVEASDLPGTYTNENGLYEPKGVVLDEGQFGGNKGVVISGMATGNTARVCFDFPTYNSGWKGSVYMYDGSEWVILKTNIDTSSDVSACSNSVANGTYALVVHYEGTSK